MNKKSVIILGIFFLLAIISFNFDSEIVEAVSLIRGDFLNNLFLGITFASSGIIIFFVLTSLFLWQDRKRKWILPLWLSLGLSALVSFLLKILVQRPRPFQLNIVSVLDALQKISYSVWNFSFPSFQAMMVFSAIPILSKEFPKFKYVWVVFACLVAFSRVYFGVHFLSDVLFGGIIGYLIGFFIVNLEKQEKIWSKIYLKILRR